MVNGYTSDKKIREYWPKAPAFYHEIESENPTLKEWGVGQKLVKIDDLRSLIRSIPSTRIGPEKATSIFNWMKENGVRQDLVGLLDIINDERILEVPGIGNKLLDDMRWGLFATLEERERGYR
jgi:hypothetical protein